MRLPAHVRDAQSSLSTDWSRGSVDADKQTAQGNWDTLPKKRATRPAARLCHTLVTTGRIVQRDR